MQDSRLAGRRCHGSAWALSVVLALCAAALAATEGDASARGPTLLRKCCRAHEQLSASLKTCVAYEGAAGETRAAWEGAGAVRRRAGDGFPWWLHAATPLYDAQTGNATARPLLRAQPPDAVLRYGPDPPCARSAYKYFTWNSFSRYRLLSNGTLLLRTDDLPSTATPNLPLPPDLYCSDRVDAAGDTFVFITCPCETTVCVRKCCSSKQELSIGVARKSLSRKCIPRMSQETWTPVFYSSKNSNVTTSDVEYILLPATIPHCSSSIRVLSNGSALMQNYGHGSAYPPDAWCADTSLVGGEWRVPNALVCVRLEANRSNPVSRVLYGSLFLLSSLCLAATLLVFALLPDLRRSAHAKALLSHAAALLAGSLTLAATHVCYTVFYAGYVLLAERNLFRPGMEFQGDSAPHGVQRARAPEVHLLLRVRVGLPRSHQRSHRCHGLGGRHPRLLHQAQHRALQLLVL
ncbi:Class B secretin-like G-protein coupled receptor GPRmth6, putative, partial [Gryllus bimaculatus]